MMLFRLLSLIIEVSLSRTLLNITQVSILSFKTLRQETLHSSRRRLPSQSSIFGTSPWPRWDRAGRLLADGRWHDVPVQFLVVGLERDLSLCLA